MKYNFAAINKNGFEINGSLLEAAVIIKQEYGAFPTRIIEGERDEEFRKKQQEDKIVKKKTRISRLELEFLTRNLAILTESGFPLLRSLNVLQKSAKNKNLKNVINDISLNIEGGMTLSEALGEYPQIFDRLYIGMARAGEVSGILEIVLTRLADYLEDERSFKKNKGDINFQIANMFRALGTMVNAGVPIIQALEVSKSIVADPVLEEALEKTKNSIKFGESIVSAFENSGISHIAVSIIDVGEQTGTLPEAFLRIADNYHRFIEPKNNKENA